MRWFLIFFGIIEATIAVFFIFAILNQLDAIYSLIGEDQTRFIFGYIYFCLLFIIGLIQIIRSLFFKNSSEKISKYLFFTGIGLLILLIPVIMVVVIYPIYALLDTVGT